MAKLNKNVVKTLQEIQASGRVSKDVGEPLLKQGLIEVNTDDVIDGLAAARLTDKALAEMPAPEQANTNNESAGTTMEFGIITNAVLPPSKRGNKLGSGAPPKYPFATMEVNHTFFVPATAKTPDPVKTMGSTVAVQNHKYSEGTGEFKEVERTKRGPGNKALLDAQGNKIRETVKVEVRKPVRKFTIRPVKGGETYGGWTAPGDGALIARTL